MKRRGVSWLRVAGGSIRRATLAGCVVATLAGSVAVAIPSRANAAELTPTSTHLTVSPNPTPQGEYTNVTAHVTPAPTGYAGLEFVYADAQGRTWTDTALVNQAGDAYGRPKLGVGTYEVTAFFLGSDDLGPSTSGTVPFAVLERIVTIPGFSFEYETVYADQTVPFTMWARPAPLSGDLRLNAGTYLRSGDYPATAGDAHGSLDFMYGTYDVYAELRRSSAAAKGCPVRVTTQLRPDEPQLTVSPASAPAGEPLTFELSVFDPSALPGIYGFLSAELHFRHEDGSDVISRHVAISGGTGSTVWTLSRPGRYDVWFTLADYIWAVPESNHVSITTLPFYDQPVSPLPGAKPGAVPTTITLDPLPATAWKDDLIPFRVTIDPAPPQAGRVTIEDGSHGFTLMNPTSTPGVFVANGIHMPAGPHRFRATYGGSDTHAPSVSEPQDLFADSIPTTTTLTFTPNDPDGLTDVTLTATVSPVPPSGTVYIYRDGTYEMSGQVNTTTGKVSWTRTWPTWAVHHLTASFMYGGKFADSHSEPVTLEVDTAPTEVTLTGPTRVANAGVKTWYSAAFAEARSIYAWLALYVDGARTSVAVTENPQEFSATFTPGRHTVQVLGSPQPGVEGWSNVLTVDVGPYANRSLIQGTVVVNNGNPFTNSEVVVVEPSLATNSPYATSFQLSNDGVHWATFDYVEGFNNTVLWDLSDAACGGSDGPGEHRLYYRWTNYQGADGVPIESTTVTITGSENTALGIDLVAPTVSAPSEAANPSALGADPAVATRIAWGGSDNLSGIGRYELEQSTNGGDWQSVSLADPTSRSVNVDLVADSSYQFRVRARDRAGNLSGWATSDAIVPSAPPSDVTPPVVSAPSVALVSGNALAANPLVTVSWPAGSDVSGLSTYRLETRSNGGGWAQVTTPGPLATSVNLGLAPGRTYEFRLRATDVPGNTSDYVTSAAFRLTRLQEKASAIKYVGAWKRVTLNGAAGGYVKKASVSGATATYIFSGRWIAIASTLGPNRGTVRFTLDGATTTVDLYSPTTRTAWLVYSVGLSPGSHTLVMEATGLKNSKSTGKRVDLDALVVLQ
jgi:hypothetical protein